MEKTPGDEMERRRREFRLMRTLSSVISFPHRYGRVDETGELAVYFPANPTASDIARATGAYYDQVASKYIQYNHPDCEAFDVSALLSKDQDEKVKTAKPTEKMPSSGFQQQKDVTPDQPWRNGQDNVVAGASQASDLNQLPSSSNEQWLNEPLQHWNGTGNEETEQQPVAHYSRAPPKIKEQETTQKQLNKSWAQWRLNCKEIKVQSPIAVPVAAVECEPIAKARPERAKPVIRARKPEIDQIALANAFFAKQQAEVAARYEREHAMFQAPHKHNPWSTWDDWD